MLQKLFEKCLNGKEFQKNEGNPTSLPYIRKAQKVSQKIIEE